MAKLKGSEAGSFNRKDVPHLIINALVIGGVTALLYLAEIMRGHDFGQYTMLVQGVASYLALALKRWLTDNNK